MIAVSESLGDELFARGLTAAGPKPAEALGLVMASFGVLAWIPGAGGAFGVVAGICWVVYWIRIARARRLLRSAPAALDAAAMAARFE